MEFCVDSIYRLPFSFQNQEKWQEETSTLVEEEVSEAHQLIVYNDEVNSFEYVILTLIEVCEHTPQQAEQCALQIHFRGKCAVKTGGFDELVSMRNEICRRGISAEIEASV